MSSNLIFYYKRSDFDTSAVLCNNSNSFYQTNIAPLYNDLTSLNIIGTVMLNLTYYNTDEFGYINGVITFYINGSGTIGYIHSFRNPTTLLVTGTVLKTDINFKSGLYNGRTGYILTKVLNKNDVEVSVFFTN
jgi:hypothetical protein